MILRHGAHGHSNPSLDVGAVLDCVAECGYHPSRTPGSALFTSPAIADDGHMSTITENPPHRTRRRYLAVSALAVAATLLAGACSDSEDDNPLQGSPASPAGIIEHGAHDDGSFQDDFGADDESDAQEDTDDMDDMDDVISDRPAGVPKECSIFPFAMEPADPDEISLEPAGWPAPPSGSTLCVTSTTVDGDTEVAEYALGAERETILGYYEAQLDGRYELAREAGIGAGDILTGYDDAIGFQISTRDGGFKIAFSEL